MGFTPGEITIIVGITTSVMGIVGIGIFAWMKIFNLSDERNQSGSLER